MQRPYFISVTSGKGGVGKSILTANIAAELAKYSSVLVWDADSRFPNQHLLFGVEPPVRLNEVYIGKSQLASAIFKINRQLDLLADMPATGVGDVPPASAFFDLFEKINGLGYDYILIDTPAGGIAESLQVAAFCDKVMLVMTDEPTSLLDCNGLLKIYSRYLEIDKIDLIINNVDDFEDADDIMNKFNLATKKFLGAEIPAIGVVPYDRSVRQSIIRQELLSEYYPESESAKQISKIAINLREKILNSELIYSEK